ncbi:MAG: hypothetical protein HC767_12830 [Akkermansiaceae bacterium]|nr:hypothetical protein [Akkermansiaceae bacterium]
MNDIYAMGGRPVALVDVIFSKDEESAGEVLRGIRDNAERYGVPVVGGHTTLDAESGSLSVFILGKAEKLLSGFGACPGDDILLAADLEGKFYPAFNFWDSSSGLAEDALRRQLEILPELAEGDLADAAKDVSMAGLIGSALMMLEGSKAGAEIYLDRIPAPGGRAASKVAPDVPELRLHHLGQARKDAIYKGEVQGRGPRMRNDRQGHRRQQGFLYRRPRMRDVLESR